MLLIALLGVACRPGANRPDSQTSANSSLFQEVCTWDESRTKKKCRPATWEELPWWERCGKLTEDGEEFEETRDECSDRLVMGSDKSREERTKKILGDDLPWFSECEDGEKAEKCMDRIFGRPDPHPECKKGEAWTVCAKRTAKDVRARRVKGIWTDKCKKGEHSIPCYRRLFPEPRHDEGDYAGKRDSESTDDFDLIVMKRLRMQKLKSLKEAIEEHAYMAILCETDRLRYALETDEYTFLCTK